ncbi:MAG: hypothetical protein H6598_03110 [Flavobacteriales bacterium]|nr:hypothetical protein [Flavobacteriales bacterium]
MSNSEIKHLKLFNRNSYLTLIFYLIAVSVTIFFAVNDYEKIIASSVKIGCYVFYLGFMTWSLVNLKDYFEATRKDDFSMDILIYAIIGIPVYIFAFFFIRAKLKSDLEQL